MFFIVGLSALFGLSVGSFLNVVIYRLDFKDEHRMFLRTSGVGFLRGRSYCPHCRTVLKWYELVPILSFLVQRKKCNSCGGPISWQYPSVELGTAVVFALITWQYFRGGF